jgi:hypothetical protein
MVYLAVLCNREAPVVGVLAALRAIEARGPYTNAGTTWDAYVDG